jgi:acetyl-CoA synthetase
MVNHPSVVEAAAIGVPDPVKGSQVIVFCVLKEPDTDIDAMRSDLRMLVASAMGKPLIPRDILFVTDLPKTRNAKVMRRMIRAAYLGEDPGDTSSLLNPEAVEQIRRAR